MTEQRRQKILIADDEQENRAALTDLLRDDYDLFTAKDGVEALEKAELHRPDLILLDVMMPRLDGFEVLKQLKADEALREISVIVVTSLDTASDEEEALSLGATDYVTKPFHPGVVRNRVDNTCTMVRHISELREALARIQQLQGLLPICAHCKRIRDDRGDWEELEAYITQRSEAAFTHSICPRCLDAYYSKVKG